MEIRTGIRLELDQADRRTGERLSSTSNIPCHPMLTLPFACLGLAISATRYSQALVAMGEEMGRLEAVIRRKQPYLLKGWLPQPTHPYHNKHPFS